jgi:VWFA-related protein
MIILCLASGVYAQDAQSTSPALARVVVTAVTSAGREVPSLGRQDVSVHVDKKPCPVADLTPMSSSSEKLQLAILIDQSSTMRLGQQSKDISQFIDALPADSSIAVAYAMNGTVMMQQTFTTDRTAVNKALHLTAGPSAGNTAIYEALASLIKDWSRNTIRREVLLISDGIDDTYGLQQTEPGQNPSLRRAIQRAQQENITVFSIFVSSGRATRNEFLNLNGQSSLADLTTSTGGYAFSQGTQTPISFGPFLDDLKKMLGQQYLLTFRPAPFRKHGYHDLKAAVEIPHVKLLAPTRIYLP